CSKYQEVLLVLHSPVRRRLLGTELSRLGALLCQHKNLVKKGDGSVSPGCSADFQSAVSPTSSRLTAGEPCDTGVSRRLRIGNPRYGRLETCATSVCAGQD